MPNFALIKPVGGQRRSMNDYMQEADQRRSADIQRQSQELQLQEGVQRQTDRTALRDIVQRSGGNWEQASQEAAAAGVSPDAVMALQDRAYKGEERVQTKKERARADTDYTREEAAKQFEIVPKLMKGLSNVYDDQSYGQWLTSASELARAYSTPEKPIQFNPPPNFDKTWVESKKKTLNELDKVFRILSPQEEVERGLDPAGTYQVGKDGEVKPIELKQPKSVEQWGAAMSPEDVQAAGYPAGSVVHRSNRGKPLVSYTPKAGSGSSPAKVATAEWIMRAVPGISEEEAYDKANTAGKNPLAFATDMVKLEAGNLSDGMKPEELQQRIQFWMDNIPGRGPTQPSAQPAPQPAGSLPQSAAAQLKEGEVMTFGNGQQWTLHGGKPVKVK